VVYIWATCYNIFMEKLVRKLNHGLISIAFFVLSMIFLLLLTLFESALADLSIGMQRILSAFFLVIPGVIGVLFGISSLLRKDDRHWIAVTGILFNTLFALFHVFLLTIAG